MKSIRIDFRLVLMPVLALLALAIYTWTLQPMNAYMGVVPVVFDLDLLAVAVIWLVLAFSIMPRAVRRPSDLFLLFYIIACFFWGSVLWSATGLLTLPGAALLLALLYTPALVIKAFQRFATPLASEFVAPVYLFKRNQLVLLLTGLLAIGAFFALVTYGPGDFGLDNVYERRIAGRDAISGSALAGYAINMTINGMAPLLAFIAGYRRSPLVMAIALAYVLLLFWQIGLKSPFVNVAALAGIGFALSVPALRRNLGALALLGLISAFAYVVWEIADGGYSALADYVVRRVAMVQPQLQSYYVDLWSALPWRERLFGAPLGEYADWTFIIGSDYLNNPQDNANTNGFLHALLKGGMVGYLAGVVTVGAFLAVLDAMYERSAMPEFVAIGGLYGILVSEQGYATALVSSGVLACALVTMLCAAPRRRGGLKPA